MEFEREERSENDNFDKLGTAMSDYATSLLVPMQATRSAMSSEELFVE